MLLICLIQQLWVWQVDCRRWPHTCCPCIVSAVGDVVRQAVGLTHLGHFYVQTGVFSDLSSIPAPRSSWEHSVLMLQTRAACTLWWGCSTSAGCATSATQ